MAVNRLNWLRISTAALALSVIALPGAAMADPERERGGRGEWRDGNAGNRGQAWQGRQAPAPQPAQQSSWSPPRQASEAPPAPPPQSRGSWGQAGGNRGNWEGRGNRENWQDRGQGDERRSRGDWQGRSQDSGNAWRDRTRVAPQPASPAQPATPAQPARPPQGRSDWGQAGGNHGNWEGRGNGDERSNRGNWEGRGNGDDRPNRGNWEGRGNRDGSGVATWRGRQSGTQTVPPVTTDRTGTRGDGTGTRDARWTRDGDRREGGWSGSGRTAWTDRSHSPDRRNDRWGDHGGDRSYWRNRNWRNHWDRSRHHRWSGWNNHWNWTWGSHYSSWNRHWRNNYRYDWYGWRNRYPSYFQVGIYYAPYRNYSYRRLSIGHVLDSMFFGDEYWIADPGYYRLPEVYGPYRWVRYYDDALLVDIYSGEVVDVIHDFFW
jgi:hypothetical protein